MSAETSEDTLGRLWAIEYVIDNYLIPTYGNQKYGSNAPVALATDRDTALSVALGTFGPGDTYDAAAASIETMFGII